MILAVIATNALVTHVDITDTGMVLCGLIFRLHTLSTSVSIFRVSVVREGLLALPEAAALLVATLRLHRPKAS